MDNPSLDHVVAEWSLGLYPPEKMPALAVWALEHGFDGKALRELAGPATATHKEHYALIDSAFRELGIEPIDHPNAVRFLASRICEQIVSGRISPSEGASRIWTISHRTGYSSSLRPFVGFASEWETDHDHYDYLILIAAREFLGLPTHSASVRFFLTEDEFHEAVLLKRSVITNRYFRIAGRAISGCGAILILSLIWLIGENPFHLFATEPLTATLLLLIVIFQVLVALGVFEAKFWNRRINRFDQERQIILTDDGVTITRGPKTWTNTWKDFSGFYESSSLFVLQTFGNHFWTVPKRALAPDVEQLFTFFLRSRLRRKQKPSAAKTSP